MIRSLGPRYDLTVYDNGIAEITLGDTSDFLQFNASEMEKIYAAIEEIRGWA